MNAVSDVESNDLLTATAKRLRIDVSTCDINRLKRIQVELMGERAKAMSRRSDLPHPDVYAAAIKELKAAF